MLWVALFVEAIIRQMMQLCKQSTILNKKNDKWMKKKFWNNSMIFNEHFDNQCPVVMNEMQSFRPNSGHVDIYLKRVILSGV